MEAGAGQLEGKLTSFFLTTICRSKYPGAAFLCALFSGQAPRHDSAPCSCQPCSCIGPGCGLEGLADLSNFAALNRGLTRP
jgi:hypothetical protein